MSTLTISEKQIGNHNISLIALHLPHGGAVHVKFWDASKRYIWVTSIISTTRFAINLGMEIDFRCNSVWCLIGIYGTHCVCKCWHYVQISFSWSTRRSVASSLSSFTTIINDSQDKTDTCFYSFCVTRRMIYVVFAS